MDLHVAVLILHVLGAGVLVGYLFYAVLLTVKTPLEPVRAATLRWLTRFPIYVSGFQFITGLILSAQDWTSLKSSAVFWTKIALYMVEGVLAGSLIDRKIKAAAAGTTQRSLPILVLIHTILIVAIVGLGVILVEQ